ncbi:MAG: FKBP-type peptidyl-prolyl cis-trans isomerase [Propionibacteriaceae bacterium]|nr:FKBP-type peptidyl-prolyl cis-trans isomerase [Propionibacteriaceae bacterium]
MLIAAAAALALTACAGSPEPSVSQSASPSPTPTDSATPTPTPTPTIPATNSLDGITVTGKRLEAPKVEFDKPLRIDQTRFEVLEPGEGPKASESGLVTVHYYGVNARSGEVFDESFANGTPATFQLSQVIPGFQKGLTGQQPGSRVLIAVSGEDGYDPSYQIDPQYAPTGYELFDTLLFVVDIMDVSLTEPAGSAVTPPAGLPPISSGTGKPTVTIPATAAPTSMVAQTLIEGTGRKVEAEDTILARYVGYSWKTGEVFDDGFETPTSEALANLIPGWSKGLKGKTVGSRVLLVLPPADGFPEGANNPPVEKGDTVVYVVDLLFAYAR